VFPTFHQICKLQDLLLWDTSTKLFHERWMSVTVKMTETLAYTK